MKSASRHGDQEPGAAGRDAGRLAEATGGRCSAAAKRPAPRRAAALAAAWLAACAGPAANAPGASQTAPGTQLPDGAIDPDAANYSYPYPVQFFELDSQTQHMRMAYLDVAPAQPNGRTVLLLHGKNFTAAAWASTIALLSERGFRVVAPDQIGFGKSSKPLAYQYSFAQLAKNTRALLASLGVERSVVIGHSMGGMLSARYALSYPAHVERLIMVCPIGLEDYSSLVPYRSVDQTYADELKQTPDKIREYQTKSYYAGQWSPAYEALAKLQMGMTLHPDYARVAWASALTYDMIYTQPIVHELPSLKVPTSLIIGLRDKTAVGRAYAPPEVAAKMGDFTQLGKRARDAIPGAKLVELDGVGHIPQVEAFDRYREALLPLLE
jgi:pimeloyl-ACP methyl ester carboxylesterase